MKVSLWRYLWHEYGLFVMIVVSMLILVSSVEPRPPADRSSGPMGRYMRLVWPAYEDVGPWLPGLVCAAERWDQLR